MDFKDFKDHIDSRLDKIEDKLDNHLERIAKAEESIKSISGHLNIAAGLFVSAFIGTISALYNLIIK